VRRFDLVRVDHFRGLAGYWAVPAAALTAREGAWLPAPGSELLMALRDSFGPLPLVAEDLGVITPDVVALRRSFGLPGMRVLQFAFDGAPDNPHLPRNYTPDTVAYTGTHDNDTTLGWYRSLDRAAARRVAASLGVSASEVPRAMLGAVLASVAILAVVPLQDVLGLGSEARFNVPGTVGGNWRWRVDPGALSSAVAGELRAVHQSSGRTAPAAGDQ
jgi:4-alpha-glucanotransferase